MTQNVLYTGRGQGASAWGFPSGRLWSLWDMLHSYLPLYQIALSLQSLRTTALFFKDSVHQHPPPSEVDRFKALLNEVHQTCSKYGLDYPSDMAKRILSRPMPESYAVMFPELDHLNDSLSHELEKEAVFRVPPERKNFFECDDLFGSKVADAFPSCERDIQKAGSCYALGQEDACFHHLMLVLERGLTALAAYSGHAAVWH